MTSAQAQLELLITAQNQAQAELRRVGGQVDALGEKTGTATARAGGLGKALGAVGSVAGGFVVAQGLLQLPALMDAASTKAANLELQAKKVQTVFGPDQAGDVKDWADQVAAAMGLTSREAQGLAANFGDLLIPMGFSREQAAAMSTDVIGLSGALAEWSGGTRSATEVSQILASAMLGERDALKGLGISITEADVSQKLLENGTNKLTGAALEQAKAIATQQLIMEKSTDAQHAFAAGSDTAARAQAEQRARTEELKEELAVRMAPVLEKITELKLKIANALVEHLLPAVDRFSGWVRDHREELLAIWNGISTAIEIAWAIAQPILRVWLALMQHEFRAAGAAVDAVSGAIDWLVDAFRRARATGEELLDAVRSTFNGIRSAVEAALNPVFALISRLESAVSRAKSAISSIPGAGAVQAAIGAIPGFAAGGVVPGPVGAPMMAVVHGGERITPAGQAGGNTYITIQAGVGDPVAIGRQVAEVLNQAASVSGPIVRGEAIAA